MRLAADELRKHTALNITNLEDDQELQEDVLSLYHCYQIMASVASQSYIELSDAKIERSRQCYYVSACT